MRLGMEGPALEPGVLAFAHDALHVLQHHFQVTQQNPLELVAPGRIGRDLPHLPQRQGHVALENLLAQRRRSAKEPMGQLLNVPDAQIFAADRHDELFDLLLLHPVHAPELAQSVHIRIDREGPAEELLPHHGAHLAQ